ncbi:MAG: caspase family protein [Planctomycetota bacterium]|nr:caspase family protein [Planctomycetota bacterium]
MSDAKPLSPAWIAALVIALGAAGFVVWTQVRGGPAEVVPPPPKEVEVREDTYALLVGVTDYPKVEADYRAKGKAEKYRSKVHLEGPAHDVDLMRVTLRDYLGVPDANITVLTGWPDDAAKRPTRANILAWLDRRAQATAEGDRVVFHYSGHGEQVYDQDDDDGESELDGYDEVLLPADVERIKGRQRGLPGCITDDELRERFTSITNAGATVWASIDCCHAGSMARGGDGTRVRRLDPSVLGLPEPGRSRGGLAREPAGQGLGDLDRLVAFYAVQSYQLAPEKKLPPGVEPADRTWHGVYTYLLARTIQRFGGAISFEELYEHLLAAYETLPYDAVSPFAEGRLELKVARDEMKREPPLLLRVADEGLLLNAGTLRGLGRESELDIYLPLRDDQAEQKLGTVKITEAGLVRSLCVPVGDRPFAEGRELPALMEARITKAVATGFQLFLAVTDEAGTELAESRWPEELKAFKEDRHYVERIKIVAPADADWALRIGKRGLRLERLEAGPDTAMFMIQPHELGERLYGLFTSQNLRRIAAGDVIAPLPEDLSVLVLKNGEPVGPSTVFRPGDLLDVKIRNDTSEDYALTAIQVDANHHRTITWPKDRSSDVLTKRDFEEVPAAELQMTDDAFGTECLVVLAVPTKKGQDRFYFRNLAGRGLEVSRGPGWTALKRSVADLILGKGTRSRGSTPSPDPEQLAVQVVTWRTDWGPLGVSNDAREGAKATPDASRGLHGAGSGSPTTAPSPWFVGDQLAVVSGGTGDDRTSDMIATWTKDILQVYVLSEGQEALMKADAATLAGRIAKGDIQVEIALRLEPERRSAWYSPKGFEQPLSRVLVDDDEDARADHRYERGTDGWTKEPSDAHWLTTGHLDWTFEADEERRWLPMLALAKLIQR